MSSRYCPLCQQELAFQPDDDDDETWVCLNCGYASHQGTRYLDEMPDDITDPNQRPLQSGGCLLPVNLLWR